MATPAAALEALPPAVAGALTTFGETLSTRLGQNLVALALYGGAARGAYREQTSDLNLLVVLSTASLGALDEIAAASAVARRTVCLDLLTVEEADLPDCTEVFATKFSDIQRHHVLLHGRDVLRPLVISRERLLRQARRELLNLKLRLRKAWLLRQGRADSVAVALERGRKTVQVNLHALLDDPTLCSSAALRSVLQTIDQPAAQGSLEHGVETFFQELDQALKALGPS
jgi:predicted nucleotidyltransferase